MRTVRSHEIWPCLASPCPHTPVTLASFQIFEMDKLLPALEKIFFLVSLLPQCFYHNRYCARDRQEEEIKARKEPKCQIPACAVSGLCPLPRSCPIHPPEEEGRTNAILLKPPLPGMGVVLRILAKFFPSE